MKAGNKVTAYKYNKNDELLRINTLNTNTEEDTVVLYKNDRNGNQRVTVNRYEMRKNLRFHNNKGSNHGMIGKAFAPGFGIFLNKR